MSPPSRRLQRGPSWFEVSLGAALSVALGVLLGALYMATRPVKKVGEIPKDAPPGSVFYIEGVRGFYGVTGIEAKRKAFVSGESVTVDEAELNVLFGGPPKPPPAPLPANTLVQPPPPPPPKEFEKLPLNARIFDGKIQFAELYAYNDYGFNGVYVVQARGTFVKVGPTFQFIPDEFYAGSCPLQRVPYIREWIMRKILFTYPVPDDIAAAWSKLSDVTIEGSKMRLKMP
ncbi:MAG TPA: hypothetical protein VN775_09500 [Opitutaceae bacterium]|nr:hypothetical protein [Opitutaceae bacterium]